MKVLSKHVQLLAFACNFIALYLPDLSLMFPLPMKMFKYLSYILFAFGCVGRGFSSKKFGYAIAALAFSAGTAVFTRDIYYSSLVLIAFSMSDIDYHEVFKLSFYLLSGLMITTLLLAFAGILPMVVTSNNIISGRMGMGYYHSNVLPLVVFYLLVFRIFWKDGELKRIEMIMWSCIAGAVYVACRSRNGFLLTLMLTSAFFVKTFPKAEDIIEKVFNFKICRLFMDNSILLLSAFSLTMSLIAGKGLRWVYLVNRFFTGRFALAYLKMQIIGLHFINLMGNEEFNVGYTLDNGYIYTILRFGILFILIYIVIQRRIVKKCEYNVFCIFAFAVVSLSNFIDNDLLSYGFLPLIVMAASDHWQFSFKEISKKYFEGVKV